MAHAPFFPCMATILAFSSIATALEAPASVAEPTLVSQTPSSEPTPPPPATAPTIIVMTAPPPVTPAPQPGDRLHDGFFLRTSFGLGPGTAHETLTVNSTDTKLDWTGTSLMLDIMIGGSPFPGFSLGGALVYHGIVDPDVEVGGQKANLNGTLGIGTLGLFAVYYPNPRSGFNFHGILGYSSASFDYNSDGVRYTSSTSPHGLSLMGGVGYDFWIGKQWSMGPDFRLMYMHGTDNVSDGSDKLSVIIPTLSFTATYN